MSGSSNTYNSTSGLPRYAIFYYWDITKQTTSYTWYITGTLKSAANKGALYNGFRSNEYITGTILCTISAQTTYTYTGILYQNDYLIIRTTYKTKESYSSSDWSTITYYKYFNPLTIYRVNNTYGWG